MSHRHLGQVLPSVCALKQALMSPLTTHQDLLALGRHETELWSESLRRLIEFREEGHAGRFFDVGFTELQSDPIAAMEALYRELGDELTYETRARMAQWWQESESDRRRGPRPDPGAFGLDLAGMNDEFAFYHDRFAPVLT